MSKKYIECEAAKEQIRAHIIIGEPKTNVGLNLAVEAIDEVPAADVVEVVRCRECMYWEPASPTRTSGNCNRSFDILAWANDFCSYGKRKDGGQDDV